MPFCFLQMFCKFRQGKRDEKETFRFFFFFLRENSNTQSVVCLYFTVNSPQNDGPRTSHSKIMCSHQ